MPLIRVDLFDFRVNEETSAKLIAGLTDSSLRPATHEGLGAHTWVIVRGPRSEELGPRRQAVAGGGNAQAESAR